MKATAQQVADLANAIAGQAEAIAQGCTKASPHAVARLMAENVATLVAWTEEEVRPWPAERLPSTPR
jgi:hypothetical protein